MYANIFELNKCLKDCISYCEQYPDREHSQFYGPLLRDAQRQLNQSTERANKEFAHWRHENRDDMLAWKHLSKELAATQRDLRRVNAIGFFDQKVDYWDREQLLTAVREMLTYLKKRSDDIDFAAKRIKALERQRSKAQSEVSEADHALGEYVRFSKMRSEALMTTKDTIANFRKTLRRELTVADDDYQGIRWPQQVSPDNQLLS